MISASETKTFYSGTGQYLIHFCIIRENQEEIEVIICNSLIIKLGERRLQYIFTQGKLDQLIQTVGVATKLSDTLIVHCTN